MKDDDDVSDVDVVLKDVEDEEYRMQEEKLINFLHACRLFLELIETMICVIF